MKINPTIQKLIDQSTETLSGWDERRGNFKETYCDKHKLSNLIILECIKICNSRVGNSDYNTGRMHCASDIKEHFGI